MNPRADEICGAEPLISLVCSTIGRPDALRRLIASVAACDIADRIEFVLIDQSKEQTSAELIRSFGLPGPYKLTTSGLGVSTGRNAGTPLATAPIVAYPDDNCWYPPATLRSVVERLAGRPDLSGVAGMQVTECGQPSMLRWLPTSVPVDRRNFMRTSVSSTIFLRRADLPSPTPFDEGIGVGSPGLRGSGEESDLILRMIARGARIQYFPDLQVFQEDDRAAPTQAYVDKQLKYGVGHGDLWRRHQLPVTLGLYLAARKLAGAGIRAARGQRLRAKADLANLRGQAVGWFGAQT